MISGRYLAFNQAPYPDMKPNATAFAYQYDPKKLEENGYKGLEEFDESNIGKYTYIKFIYDTDAPEVYNAADKDDATIWLSGGGFKRDDLLNTKALTSGSDYDAMMQLRAQNDVLGTTEVVSVFKLSLKSGMKVTGDDIYINLDLSSDSAGQMFTLVYKKPDGGYEYFYANADANGIATFGPFYELAPVMLVKGMLPNEPMNVEEMNTQAGGVFEMYILGVSVWWFIGIGAALVVGAVVAVVIILRKRKKANK